MTDPTRLIISCDDPVERAILQSGMKVRASTTARRQTLLSLGLSDKGHTGRLLFFARHKGRVFAAAVAVSTLAAATPVAYRALRAGSDSAASAPIEVSAAQLKPVAAYQAVLRATPQASENVPPQPDQAAGIEASADRSASLSLGTQADSGQARRNSGAESGAVAWSSKPVATNVLVEELSALDAARKKLNAGDALSALAMLDAYDRGFTRPRLSLEAEVLRIFAYDKAGQVAVAKKRAAAFVAKHPKGVLTARVRRYLEP